MDYLNHLKWIQEMIDRADPGRKMREQMFSVQDALDRADPGRKMREQMFSAQEALDRADPGRAMREQQEQARRALDQADPGRELREENLKKIIDEASSGLNSSQIDPTSLLAQYESRLQVPEDLLGYKVPGLEVADFSNPTLESLRGLREQFSATSYELSRQIAGQIPEMPAALSASLTALEDAQRASSALDYSNRSIATAAREVLAAHRNFGANGFTGLADFMTEKPAWLDGIQAAASPVLDMLAYEMATVFSAGLSPAMAEGFGAELVGHIGHLVESESEERAQEAFEEFLTWLLDWFSRLPNIRVTRESALAIFLTLVAILHSQVISQQSEKRIEAMVAHSQASVERRIDELSLAVGQEDAASELKADSVEVSSLKIVATNLRLRSGPGTEFDVLRLLPPNLTVSVLSEDKDWALIEFFDFIEGKPVKGWAAKKFLMDWQAEPDNNNTK